VRVNADNLETYNYALQTLNIQAGTEAQQATQFNLISQRASRADNALTLVRKYLADHTSSKPSLDTYRDLLMALDPGETRTIAHPVVEAKAESSHLCTGTCLGECRLQPDRRPDPHHHRRSGCQI